jgi:hypothetical protein
VKSPFPHDVCRPAMPVCTVTIVVCNGTHGVCDRTSTVCTLAASVCNVTNGTDGVAYVVRNVTQAFGRLAYGHCRPANIVCGLANIVCDPVWPRFSPHFLTCRPCVLVLLSRPPVEDVPFAACGRRISLVPSFTPHKEVPYASVSPNRARGRNRRVRALKFESHSR